MASAGLGMLVVGLAVLLVSEARGWRTGVWIAKPTASTGFIVLALALGALDTAYGCWVLAALVLSWLGDVLLIPKGARTTFLLGLAAFLLGHVAYVAAFAVTGVAPRAVGVAAIPIAAAATLVTRWLLPQVPEKMRVPVRAYVVVISAMVAMGAGASVQAGTALHFVGALAFYLSDLAVALERFVARSFTNKAWGLPLYYGAQAILAWTVSIH